MSEALHTVAVLTALGTPTRNFAIGKVPDARPAYYNEVSVTRRYGGNRRGDATPTTTLYRVFVRSVGQSVTNAMEMRRLAGLLENASLTVVGEVTTPLDFETSEPVGLDDGWYSGTLQLTYAL